MANDQQLLGEIEYLTRLIQSHQKSTPSNSLLPPVKGKKVKKLPSSSKRKVRGVAQNTGCNLSPHRHVSNHFSSRHRSRSGNLSYRPPQQTRHDGTKQMSLNTASNVIPPQTTVMPNKQGSSSAYHGTETHLTLQYSNAAPHNRKRRLSNTKIFNTPSKKLKNDKYVWKPSDKPQCRPGKKMKQRRKSHDKESSSNTHLHTSHSTIKNKELKFSESLKSGGKCLTSPMIAKGRFKLVRSSLSKKVLSPTYSRRLNTFHYRRLRYVMKHTSSRSSKYPFKSKNRVWVASSTESSDVEQTTHSDNVWIAKRQMMTSQLSGRCSSLVSINGSKYVMDSSKRRLKRRSISSGNSAGKSVGIVVSMKNYLASRAVQKSREYIWRSRAKNKVLNKLKHYCVFFNRFGKCSRGDKCPYVHDPNRIAICRKFLKGQCEKLDGTCLLSHKVAKEKMPVCSFFLHGVCNRDSCPYLHVSVGKDAVVCPDFATGYCPRGQECNLQHVLDCPEFTASGTCKKGKACPLRHRKVNCNRVTATNRKHIASVKTPIAFKKFHHRAGMSSQHGSSALQEESTQVIRTHEVEFMPLEWNQDFIAL